MSYTITPEYSTSCPTIKLQDTDGVTQSSTVSYVGNYDIEAASFIGAACRGATQVCYDVQDNNIAHTKLKSFKNMTLLDSEYMSK
jgi:hypothetical protein